LIVSNASPIIYLSRVGRLALLRQVYGGAAIPRGVYTEVVEEARGRPGVNLVKEAVSEGWIRTLSVKVDMDYGAEGLEKTDAEVISLAKSMNLPLLSNDRALITYARAQGVETKWFTQILRDAVGKGVLTGEQAEALFMELIKAGLRLRSEVILRVLAEIRES